MAGFDPDAYLAGTTTSRATPAFDPDVFLGQKPQPKVSGGETFLRRAVDAIPLGNLSADVLSTTILQALRPSPGAELTPQARAELEAQGGQEAEGPGIIDTYRDVRDTRRQRTEAGSQQNKWAGRAGTGAGLVLSAAAPLPGFKAGNNATRAQRILAAAKTGAAYGALNGATNGDADLTRGEVGGAARDTAEGGVLGGALGAAFASASEGLRPLLSRALQRYGIQQGRQAIQGGSDVMAATREPLSDAAVVEALESGGIRALDTTPAIYQRLQQLVDEQGTTYNQLVAELERMGVQGPRAADIADRLLQRAVQLEPRTMNETLPAEYLNRGAQVGGKADAEGRLTLSQNEDLKRSLQDLARYGKIEETPLNEVRRDVANIFRQGTEDAIQSAAMTPGVDRRVQTLAGDFVPVKQRFGRLAEAEGFAQKGAAKAQQRSPVGLKDVIMASGTGGGPLSTALTAAGSAYVRNRLPSTLSTAAFSLGRGLENGGLASDLARGSADVAVGLGPDVADDYANEPTTDPRVAALIRFLRGGGGSAAASP